MGDSHSIINIGDWSKPANTLIEKISAAMGGIFQPYQIRRIAQAEAEADRIRAVSRIEISDIERRAMYRFFVEEAKKQGNIETITQKALPNVNEKATPQDVEDDWITNFFDKCRLISDEQVQNLWAHVLAGEANAPGRFSKRTVNLLAELDSVDATLFTKLCSFCLVSSDFADGEFLPLIYGIDDKIYTDHGVNFDALSHLESIGLIHLNGQPVYQMTSLPQQGVIAYYGEHVRIRFDKPENNEMHLGHVILTRAGQQLASICGGQPRGGFLEYLIERWTNRGYRIDQTTGPSAPPLPAAPTGS